MIRAYPRFVLFCAAYIAALFGALPLPATLHAQQPAITHVRIEITEPAGAPVAHVPIRLVPAPDFAPPKMETDEKGQLSLDLTPGGYALFVDFPGFKAVDTFINVQNAKDIQIIPVHLELGETGSPIVYPDPDTTKNDLRISAHPYHDDLILTPAEFKVLPLTTVTVHNEHTKADETYSGVRVSDLLIKMDAPLGAKLRGPTLGAYIVATGADGYVAVVALAEADPSFHPGEVIVADAMNSQPLDAHSGPFKLVVSEDKRPARWVRNLVSLELKFAK
ncbi:MAG: hypothetical protein WA817_09690 [Candidatus Acidiferrum sp.]